MLKVIELFAGLGSQTQALKNIGVEHEVVAISEIDRPCLVSYEALHGKPNNLGDICKIERLPEADLWTYSFPCQDVSVAGKLAGISEGTRSGLLLEVERLLRTAHSEGTMPKYLLLENVKNLVSKRFRPDFDKWLGFLSSLGYSNYWKVLNAKEYGIPQNRERVFCVSILGDEPFEFPEKVELTLKLRDLLEAKVDEKYYLSKKLIECFMADGTGSYPRRERFIENLKGSDGEIGRAVTTRSGSRPVDNFVVERYGNKALEESLEGKEIEDGDFIDARNRRIKKDIAGTITAGVSNSNCAFLAEKSEQSRRCDEALEKGNLKEGDVINHSRDDPSPMGSASEGCSPTLTTRADELGVVVVDLKRGYPCEVREESEKAEGVDVIGNYSKSGFNQTPIVNKNGIAPTVTENHGQVTAIAIKNKTKKGYLLAEDGDAVDISGRMKYHRGTVQKGLSHTLTTAGGDNVGVVVKGEKSLFTGTEEKLFTEEGNIRRYIGSEKVDEFKEGQMATTSFPNGYGHGPRVHDESVSLNTIDKPCVKQDLRIRKLTPRECLRLMGWSDEQIDLIQEAGVSNSQQYKQAGNGIVIQVLEQIFLSLFVRRKSEEKRPRYEQMSLCDFGLMEEE